MLAQVQTPRTKSGSFFKVRMHYIITDLGVKMTKEHAVATHGGYTVIETI